MDWVSIALGVTQAAATISDVLGSGGGTDESVNEYLEAIRGLGAEEKELTGKYASYADMFIDPSSFWMSTLRKNMLDVSEKQADKSIQSLRGQGIYAPALEALVRKDSFVESGENFYSNVDKFLNVAQGYSQLEQETFGDYADTLATAYTTQFTADATKPGMGEQFSSAIGGFKDIDKAADSINKLIDGMG
tara:strand:+ start:139 stop:711 length:573 start_codon:yes stop_codon:yes gene_type:complete